VAGKSLSIEIRSFLPCDYIPARRLWEAIPGMGLSSADGETEIGSFLERNPGLSFCCLDGDQLVGTVLAGHDGRRGYLYHAAVLPAWRGRGIGRSLVDASLDALAKAGIRKCHLFVFADNDTGCRYWGSHGWTLRGDLKVFSRDLLP